MKDLLAIALTELKDWNPDSEAVKEIEDAIVFRESHPVDYALNILKEYGYYTKNLWHVDDVLVNYDCDEETALEVIDSVLNDDYLMEKIAETLQISAKEFYELEQR